MLCLPSLFFTGFCGSKKGVLRSIGVNDVRVQTGKRIAVLSHCLLNQNAKPYLRARYPTVVDPVIEVLLNAGFALVQLPCPEIAFGGLKRWSQVIEQYDTPKYRHHCKDLSIRVVDQIEHYLRYEFRVVIIGIDGSPSCGVRLTGSNPNWQGYPNSAAVEEEYPVTRGTGIFMQELRREIEQRKLVIPPMLGVPLDVHGVDLEELGFELKSKLKELGVV